MKSLSITNQKVIEFYEKYPNIDFETINLCMVDMLEKIMSSSSDHISKSISSQILNQLHETKNMVGFVQDFFSSQSQNQFDQRLSSFKTQIMGEIQEILVNAQEKDKTNSIKTLHEPLINSISVRMNELLRDSNKPIENGLKQSIHECENRLQSRFQNLESSSNEQKTSHLRMEQEMHDFLQKYKTSSSDKGKFAENQLEKIVYELFPLGTLEKTAGDKHSGDFILSRENAPTILLENKLYESKTIPYKEVEKFVRDCESKNCHGIMLSQHMPIFGRSNFQWELHRGLVLLYISNVNFDMVKIKIAVNLIDSLVQNKNILQQSGGSNEDDDDTNEVNTATIANEVLDSIYQEYKVFEQQKENLHVLVKDQNKKLKDQIELLQLNSLTKYLDTLYASTKTATVKCPKCGRIFGGRYPNKALSKHKCNLAQSETIISITT
jgi:hypothetical protein